MAALTRVQSRANVHPAQGRWEGGRAGGSIARRSRRVHRQAREVKGGEEGEARRQEAKVVSCDTRPARETSSFNIPHSTLVLIAKLPETFLVVTPWQTLRRRRRRHRRRRPPV
eukprot:37376-Hanusia_phi.AAC.2